MTERQRLASIILQLNYGMTSWTEAIRLARKAAQGDTRAEAVRAADAVRASLRAADAALATVRAPQAVSA